MEFEWDAAKELANIAKHGRNFAEAVEAFSDPEGIMLTDSSHSSTEQRYYWIGKTTSGRIVMVRLTRRGDKVRIIGCAEWRKFRSIYHEAAKTR